MAQLNSLYIRSAIVAAGLFIGSTAVSTPATAFASPPSCSLRAAYRLQQIEEIKQLKARYFRLMDTKQWEAWSQVFTEDATVETSSSGMTVVWQGRDQIVYENSTVLAGAITIHHGHMPEIDITSATTATGVWAMEDTLVFSGVGLHGYGHYHEEYEKVDGEWKIKRLVLTRLHEKIGPDVL